MKRTIDKDIRCPKCGSGTWTDIRGGRFCENFAIGTYCPWEDNTGANQIEDAIDDFAKDQIRRRRIKIEGEDSIGTTFTEDDLISLLSGYIEKFFWAVDHYLEDGYDGLRRMYEYRSMNYDGDDDSAITAIYRFLDSQ